MEKRNCRICLAKINLGGVNIFVEKMPDSFGKNNEEILYSDAFEELFGFEVTIYYINYLKFY